MLFRGGCMGDGTDSATSDSSCFQRDTRGSALLKYVRARLAWVRRILPDVLPGCDLSNTVYQNMNDRNIFHIYF